MDPSGPRHNNSFNIHKAIDTNKTATSSQRPLRNCKWQQTEDSKAILFIIIWSTR